MENFIQTDLFGIALFLPNLSNIRLDLVVGERVVLVVAYQTDEDKPNGGSSICVCDENRF